MIVSYGTAVTLQIGIVFAVFFPVKWINTIDEVAEKSPWTFKLMILPGCIVFWLALLKKCVVAWKGYRHD